jgi:hypothetical protein
LGKRRRIKGEEMGKEGLNVGKKRRVKGGYRERTLNLSLFPTLNSFPLHPTLTLPLRPPFHHL